MKNNFDEFPSNWEADVEAGKYDPEPVETNPVHTESRGNFSAIEDMKGREQHDKYWHEETDEKRGKASNSKPKRKNIGNDSIRFGEGL